ncbi:hypothetical protein CAP2UW1_0155 [Candidatus Accumulibacter phosphatis]|uniref:Uncharacterized protein n=1 Tax=Accumulibacter regalis TaxID=522306 RepID=C7RJF0_ACCRE
MLSPGHAVFSNTSVIAGPVTLECQSESGNGLNWLQIAACGRG